MFISIYFSMLLCRLLLVFKFFIFCYGVSVCLQFMSLNVTLASCDSLSNNIYNFFKDREHDPNRKCNCLLIDFCLLNIKWQILGNLCLSPIRSIVALYLNIIPNPKYFIRCFGFLSDVQVTIVFLSKCFLVVLLLSTENISDFIDLHGKTLMAS